jgi:hypothetical protein
VCFAASTVFSEEEKGRRKRRWFVRTVLFKRDPRGTRQ